MIVVHGGPGAPGSAGGLAHVLADPARVLEPWQRLGAPYEVAAHVADLDAVIAAHCERPPIVVGHSWGAMLALAHAAVHPERVAAVVVVCSGTFDLAARDAFRRAMHASGVSLVGLSRADRTDAIDRIYTFDPLPDDPLDEYEVDERANRETWIDMVKLQEQGYYPAALATITAPVLMVHGENDPHPGELIRASLAPHLPQLEYHELARCGHYPWRERHARAAFAELVRGWIAARAAASVG